MHELAIFVHSVLASFHILGSLYNYKRKNYKEAGLHLAVAGYDIYAVHHHIKEAGSADMQFVPPTH